MQTMDYQHLLIHQGYGQPQAHYTGPHHMYAQGMKHLGTASPLHAYVQGQTPSFNPDGQRLTHMPFGQHLVSPQYGAHLPMIYTPSDPSTRKRGRMDEDEPEYNAGLQQMPEVQVFRPNMTPPTQITSRGLPIQVSTDSSPPGSRHSFSQSDSSQISPQSTSPHDAFAMQDIQQSNQALHHHHRLPNHQASQYEGSSSPNRESGPPTMVGHEGMPLPAPRPRGPKLKFTREDDALLIELKETKDLTWKQISDFFPGRSSGTLQVRYCTKLKAKTTAWSDDMVDRLRAAIKDYDTDRWRIISTKVGNGFSATACQAKAEEIEAEEGHRDGYGGVEGEYEEEEDGDVEGDAMDEGGPVSLMQ